MSSPRFPQFSSFESGRWPLLIAIVVPVVCLLPFVQKAFHIDDTVFIWVARHIQQNPLDFFGFTANWYRVEEPMSRINQNPPGVSYFIALISAVTGEREIPLHLAFLLPAVAVSVGTYRLAKRLSPRPALAVLCALLTPAFIVSSTNVMSDTLMVAFYVWSVALWVEGLDRERYPMLAAAGFLAGLAALTKYSAVGLVPLMAVYAMAHTRRLGVWTAVLAIPVLMMIAYRWYTHRLYGLDLLAQASQFALQPVWRGHLWPIVRTVIGLGFTGGCLAVVLCFAPLLWSYRACVLALAGAVLAVVFVVFADVQSHLPIGGVHAIRWFWVAQWVLLVTGGFFVLVLAIEDLWRTRNAESFLLFCWVIGTFVFAALVNWVTAGRNILPMAPAVGILLARRTSLRWPDPSWRMVWPLLPAAGLALCAAWADYAHANSARDAARELAARSVECLGHVYFSGHWGFQLYMESFGAQPLPFYAEVVRHGDWVIVPSNNFSTAEMPPDVTRRVFVLTVPTCRWLSLTQDKTGAGFYSSRHGVLPFTFGAIPAEEYRVFQVDLSRQAGHATPQ